MDKKQAKEFKEFFGGNTIDDAVKHLEKARRNGENIFINFNGKKLYSTDVTMDSAYMEITGKNKADHDKEQAEWRENYKRETAEREAKAKAKVPTYYEQGDNLIHASQKGQWRKCVDSRVSDLYHGLDLENAIEIMQKLENDGSIKDAQKMLDDQNHSGASYGMVMKILVNFSKRGVEFYKAVEKDIKPETLKVLAEIEQRNEKETKLAESVASELHEDWRKTRLQGDGTFDPRWKAIKDKKFIASLDPKKLPPNIKAVDGGYEIDIANSTYGQLSPDWQAENKEAGKIASGLVIRGETEKLTQEQIGSEIHDEWLKRNAWAKDGELGVPFAKLPKNEQDKDLNQYKIALALAEQTQTKKREQDPLGNA